MNNYQEKVERISRLLQDRAAVFPVRDSSYEQLSSELQAFAGELLAGIDFENYKYDPGIVEEALNLSDSPVFICGSMKSGTTLLIHLLDSHPDLQVMPGDSHFVNQLKYWNRTQFKEIASYWVHRIVNPTGQEPFWFFGFNESAFNIFLAYLNYFLKKTEKDIFVCVVMSFYAVDRLIGNPASKKYWVEKTPHNELHAQMLSRLYPNAKFIHILRDPLNNIVSLKKLDTYYGGAASPLDYARVINKLFKFARINLKKIGKEKYLVIRYEELTKDPFEVMNRVCAFLDIPFHEALLTPTENGRPAVSNSMFQKDRVKGKILNREQNDRYLKEYTYKELQDVVTTLYTEAIKAGYKWDTPEIVQYKKTGIPYMLHLVAGFLNKILSRFF
ncbi:MAG: hypothetical protein OHK003_05650 [Anaerolineales bacterium]